MFNEFLKDRFVSINTHSDPIVGRFIRKFCEHSLFEASQKESSGVGWVRHANILKTIRAGYLKKQKPIFYVEQKHFLPMVLNPILHGLAGENLHGGNYFRR